MTIFDRFTVRVVAAGVGMCGAAMAFSPDVSAAPLTTGGYECIQTAAGLAGGAPAAAGGAAAAAAGAPAAAAGAPAAAACGPASAPVADMAGVPMALPGPVPIAPPVPVVPLVPAVPVVPLAPLAAGAPVAGAPVPAGVIDMANGYGGKGDRIAATPEGGPQPGQPIPPGPSPAG